MLRFKLWRNILIFITLVIGTGILVASIFIPGFPIPPEERRAISRLVGNRQFNFVSWEANALRIKVGTALGGGANHLDEASRKQLVLDYLELVGQARRLDRELESIYATEANPEQASAELRAELAAVRAASAEIQPLAESILQDQVATVLKREDMRLLNSVWPPVQAHMTPLPLMLIISPRDRIEQQTAFALSHGLTIPERDRLENQVFDELGLSALVVPIGGLGIYPAMIVETGNLNFVVETIAHEWAHHWLTLHPLGLRYAQSSALRTMNETTASIVGNEIGAQVIADYYPEFVPPPPSPPSDDDAAPDEPPAFDFRSEMRETRVQVDLFLEQGEVVSAENYMNQRREVFVENGYLIRKLNQAYFAFHGAYADSGGATGSDPVGPAVVRLREQSDSLRIFLQEVGELKNFAELEAVIKE